MYFLKLRYAKLLLPCVSIVILALAAPSCKKGDTGPAGPAGTANVIYSDWFQPATYTKDTVFGIWGFSYTQPAPGITQAVVDSGTVIVYGKLKGYNTLIWPTDQVANLPISLTYIQGTTMTDTWTGLVSAGQVKIRFVNDHNFWTSISNAHMFRYLIIPGGKKATASTANLTHMSYEQACNTLNIPQ